MREIHSVLARRRAPPDVLRWSEAFGDDWRQAWFAAPDRATLWWLGRALGFPEKTLHEALDKSFSAAERAHRAHRADDHRKVSAVLDRLGAIRAAGGDVPRAVRGALDRRRSRAASMRPPPPKTAERPAADRFRRLVPFDELFRNRAADLDADALTTASRDKTVPASGRRQGAPGARVVTIVRALRKVGSNPGEIATWARPYGADWERAWNECENAEWLIHLVGHLRESGMRSVEEPLLQAASAMAKLDPQTPEEHRHAASLFRAILPFEYLRPPTAEDLL
jgi:hypothetical protein